MSRKRYALVDRDGTIIVEKNYLAEPERVELLPGAGCGLRRLRELGLGIIVVTNQSGIGRGMFDEEKLHQIHDRLRRLLAKEEVTLDAIYFCPHAPHANCDCRKPRTKMVERAAEDFEFLPSETFVIGDKPCDIQMGQAIGATTFLVRTGVGATADQDVAHSDHVVDDLDSASHVIQRIVERSA